MEIVLNIQSLAIKENSPLFLTMSRPPTNDELSSSRSPSMSPLPVRNAQDNTRFKSLRKHSHRPAFSDVVNCASSRARREANRKQNQPEQPSRNASMLPVATIPPVSLLHPTFGIGPTFYMLPAPFVKPGKIQIF